jgi:CHAD domain-containing protein
VTPNHSETLIRQRLRALRRALPLAREGDPAAIHQARVATRRLREAIPLVAKGTRARKLERSVRRLTRALGPVRELDVASQMLDELAGAPGVPPAAVACLRQTIHEERGRLHVDLVRTIDKANPTKLTRKAVTAARSNGGASETRHPRHLAAAQQRAASRAEGLQRAIENAAAIYLPDRLHEVRIAVKKLRYSMEIARELGRSRATARILALKRVQDLLGRMHDLEVLIARTRARQGSNRAPDLRLSANLDRLVRALEAECRQLHARYIASRRSLLAICDHVIAQAANTGRKASAA